MSLGVVSVCVNVCVSVCDGCMSVVTMSVAEECPQM